MKRFIAREFLILIAAIITYFILFIVLSELSKTKTERLENINKKLIDLDTEIPFQRIVWQNLVLLNEIESNFKEFSETHNSSEKIETVFAKDLIYGSYQSQIEVLSYENYLNKFSLTDSARNDVYLLLKNEGIEINKNELGEILSKDTLLLKKAFQISIKNNYSKSFNDFKLLLDLENTSRYDSLLLSRKKLLEEVSEVKQSRFYGKMGDDQAKLELVTFIFLLFFGLRYFIYAVLWSIKQLK